MATLIDATVGAASSTAYGTVDEADAYLVNQANNAKWLDADDDERAAALNRGAERIDAERYRGQPTNDDQARAFPRTGLWESGRRVDSTTIPRRVKIANYEMALAIINGGTTDLLAPTGTENIARVKAGSVEVAFRNTTTDAGTQPAIPGRSSAVAYDASLTLPPQVWRLLRDWITTNVVPSRPSFFRVIR